MKNRKHIVAVMFIITALTALLCFTSCNSGGLDVPTNVSVNTDTLLITWDAVEGADHYMIAFNGTQKQFTTAQTSYNLASAPAAVMAELQSGKVNSVQVRAVNIETDGAVPTNASKWSEKVEFAFTKQLTKLTKFSFKAETNTIEWRAAKETGAKYKLIIREDGASSVTEKDLSSYTLKQNPTNGNITLDISSIIATLDAKAYEMSIVAFMEGYEDSEYATFVDVDLTGGVNDPVDPEDPVDPDDPVDPEDPEDPEDPVDPSEKTLRTIQAYYTGADINVGNDIKLSNITLMAYYTDDSSAVVSGFTTNFAEFKDTLGEHEVTVTYTENGVTKTTTVKVKVVEEGGEDPGDNPGGGEDPGDNPGGGDVTPIPSGYYIRGVGGDWSTGIQMSVNPSNSYEVMYIGLTVNGTDAIKIYGNNGWYGDVKDGVTVTYTHDGDWNIVLAAGTYDLYFDTGSNQLWIQAH